MKINKLILLFLILLQLNSGIIQNAQTKVTSETQSTKNQLHLIVLPKTASLKIVQDLIEKNKIKSEDIVAAFDFDQTLTARVGIKLELRGGKETAQMIEYLNKNKINWFVITASTSTTSPAITFDKTLQLQFPDRLKNACERIVSGKKDFFEKTERDISIGNEALTFKVCNNIISCYSNPYRKDMSFEFAIKYYKLPYPKFIIFVDDNAGNVETLYNHFATGLGKDKGITFYGIVYTPLIKAEEGSQEALERIEKIIKTEKSA